MLRLQVVAHEARPVCAFCLTDRHGKQYDARLATIAELIEYAAIKGKSHAKNN